MKTPGINDSDIRVLSGLIALITLYSRTSDELTHQAISDFTQTPVRTVRRALKRLSDLYLIEYHAGDGRTRGSYIKLGMTRQLELPVDKGKKVATKNGHLSRPKKVATLDGHLFAPPPLNTEKITLRKPNGFRRQVANGDKSKSAATKSKKASPAKPSSEVQRLVAHYVENYRECHGGANPLSTWTAQVGRWLKSALADRPGPSLEPVLAELARSNKSPNALSGLVADLETFSPKSLTQAASNGYRPYSNDEFWEEMPRIPNGSNGTQPPNGSIKS